MQRPQMVNAQVNVNRYKFQSYANGKSAVRVGAKEAGDVIDAISVSAVYSCTILQDMTTT